MPGRTTPTLRRTIDAMPDSLSCEHRVIWLCPWCMKANYTYHDGGEFAAVCLRCERPVEVCCGE